MPQRAFHKKIKSITICVNNETEVIELSPQETFKTSKADVMKQVKRIAEKIRQPQLQLGKEVQTLDNSIMYKTINLTNIQFDDFDLEQFQSKSMNNEKELSLLLNQPFDENLNFEENIINDFCNSLEFDIIRF